jgi:6-pyruvoyltetrahydropterin/6-carboxytetrahydropterin synthase
MNRALIYAERYHDISCGHRVVGHEGKCQFLHGHNYRVYFTCAIPQGGTDSLGRVIDFSVMKSALCMWLEDTWDHKMLLWEQDPLRMALKAATFMKDARVMSASVIKTLNDGTVVVPFNPTAENMAVHLLNIVGPERLRGTGVALTSVRVEETRKCTAMAVRVEERQ